MCQEAEEFAKILAKEKGLRHSSKVEKAGQGENLVTFQNIKGNEPGTFLNIDFSSKQTLEFML